MGRYIKEESDRLAHDSQEGTMTKHEQYYDPETDERLDIVSTPNGWVRPVYEEVTTGSGSTSWSWTFDAPVSASTYQRSGFSSKLKAARNCFGFTMAMKMGAEEAKMTKRS